MMNFRTVVAAIITVLGNAADSRFRVIGYRGQGKDAQDVRANRRLVQVYYSAGDFPKRASRSVGTAMHDMVFNVGLTVSAPCQADLVTINSSATTPTQKAAALLAMIEASAVADTLWDELAELVYQILKDGRNRDLGLAVGVIAEPWVQSLKKDPPANDGGLVVLTGAVQYCCRTTEDADGDVGVADADVNTTLKMSGDSIQATKVDVKF